MRSLGQANAIRPFAGIENVQLGQARLPFLEPANVRRDLSQPAGSNIVSADVAMYVLSFDETTFFSGRKRDTFFKCNFTIWQASPGSHNQPGTKATWMLDAASDYFQRDCKRLLSAALNMAPSALSESDFEAMISKAQPLTAQQRFVLANVENTKSKNPPHKDFTRVSFEPIDAQRDATGAVIGFARPAVDNTKETAPAA